MQSAPIRSPLDMTRAQARLAALAASSRGAAEELEYAALRDAVEHYRCITDRIAEGSPPAWNGPDAIELEANHQPRRAS